MKSILKKIIFFVGIVVSLLLISLGVMIGVSLLPIKDNYKIMAVTSGSMEPIIGIGSLIVVKPSEVYRVGDIVAFRQANTSSSTELTTHRIVEIYKNNDDKSYRTKGDANTSVDLQLVNSQQIVGKYYFSVVMLGYLVKYAKTLPGLVLIIIVPATIIVYEEIKKIHREAKKINKDRINNE